MFAYQFLKKLQVKNENDKKDCRNVPRSTFNTVNKLQIFAKTNTLHGTRTKTNSTIQICSKDKNNLCSYITVLK